MADFTWKQEYIKRLYAENEQITTLSPAQHKMLQEMATVRHKLHTLGWKVYAGKGNLQTEMNEFFNRPAQDFTSIGLEYPSLAVNMYHAMETAKDISKIANPTEQEIVTSCTDFLYARQFIQEYLNGCLSTIDRLHGTHYASTGKGDHKDFERHVSDDIRYILDLYHRGKLNKAIETLSLDPELIDNISVGESHNGSRFIEGTFENVPFSCLMLDTGKIVDITMHTKEQDLAPIPEIAELISKKCLEEFEKVKDVHVEKVNKALLISMDNTLANLSDAVVDANGKVQLRSVYEILDKPAFYQGLEPIQNMVDATRAFIKAHPEVDVYLFSTSKPDDPPGVFKQKNDWINRHLPEILPQNRIIITPQTPKSSFLKENPDIDAVLVDADMRNVEEFEREGGRAVFSCQSDAHNIAPGANIFIDKSAAQIYKELEKQMGVEHKDMPINHRHDPDISH